MNKRIFKKITSNNYIYPTRKIRKIFKKINFGLRYEEAITWFKVLKRIKIRSKLLHFDCSKEVQLQRRINQQQIKIKER